MSYGQFINHIEKVDMYNNFVRLKVITSDDPFGKDRKGLWILLDAEDAQSLVNDIYATVDAHRSSLHSFT